MLAHGLARHCGGGADPLRSGLLALLAPKLAVDVAQGVELAITLHQPPSQLANTVAR